VQEQGTPAYKPGLCISPGGVLVVEGFGARMRVEGSHLEVRSGTGLRIAEARFSRITAPRLRRVVVIAGPAGYLSIPAVRWIRDVGASLVVLAPDGDVLLAPGGISPDDARLRRQQALTAGSDLGLRISRRLVSGKITGQHDVARRLVPGAPARYLDSLGSLIADAEEAPTLEELRQIESVAAGLYFMIWKGRVRLRWARRDETHVPERWRAFPGRRSPLANGPRTAADPINALVNLASALLEVETILALQQVGLDAGIGLGLHLDTKARASAADDVMEPVRPAAEELVLRLISERVFSRRDFLERGDGHVRIAPPLAKALVEAWMPELGRAVAPWAELVATEIGRAAGIVVPTKLTESRRSAGRDPYRKAARQARTRKRIAERMVPNACRECGEVLRSRTRVLCDACAFEHRVEGAQQAGRATLARMRARGEADPARSPEARAKLGTAQSRRARERAEWERAHAGETPDPLVFRVEILPGLADVPVNRIARETGLSTAHAWHIRRGKRLPHARFWPVLRQLSEDAARSRSVPQADPADAHGRRPRSAIAPTARRTSSSVQPPRP
jgi:CRISPR-associated protein Cas1